MSGEIQPFDELLDGLRGAGRLESSGRFTVDRERGLEKLRHFRLENRHEYVLKLVQAGIAAGASEVQVEVLLNRVTVLYDACHSPEAIQELDRWVLEPVHHGPDRALTHLAVGVNAATAQAGTRLEVVSVAGGQGVGLRRGGGKEHLERIEMDRPVTRTRIGVRRPWRLFGLPARGFGWAGPFDYMLGRSMGDFAPETRSAQDSEFSQVWRRCVFAPVPVLLNGRAVNRPMFGDPKRMTRLWKGGVFDVEHPFPDSQIDAWLNRGKLCTLGPPMRFLLSGRAGPGTLPVPGTLHIPCKDWESPPRADHHRWAALREFPVGRASWRELEARVEDTHQRAGRSAEADVYRLSVQVRPPVGQRFHLWSEPALPAFAMLRKPDPIGGMLWRPRGWFTLVKDGVALQKFDPPRKSFKHWEVVTTLGDLDLDLSHFDVVRDERWEALLDCLEGAAR